MEDDKVILKLSSCNNCKGIVRTSVKHMMGPKLIKDFMKEVFEFNLIVSEVKLTDFRKNNNTFCECE